MHFVLCHGSWYSAGSFAPLQAELEAAGHQIDAVTYPGDKGDPTPAPEIHLQSYVDAVTKEIDSADGAVTLVGHSMGGTVIAMASDQRPEKVERAIYLSAFLLPHGESLFHFSQSSPEFADSLLARYLVIAAGKGTSSINPEGLREAFLADADDSVFEWAKSQTQPDYLEPSGTPVSYGRGFAGVPRFYIETTEDRAVPLAAQKRMQELVGVQGSVSIKCSHSAYITKPGEVARAILSLSGE